MSDQHIAGYRVLSKRFEHDPNYQHTVIRGFQRELADLLIPALWGTGKHVVDLTLESTPAWMSRRGIGYVIAEPEDTIIEARCLITKVEIQRVVMYEAPPISYSAYSYSELAGSATEEMKRRLASQWRFKARPWLNQQARGLFPWHFEKVPAKPTPSKTTRQKLDELARGLFPWHYE